MSLAEGILIKDNHIIVAGSIARAVQLAKNAAHHLLRVEVEAENLDEVKQALEAGADAVLLDNMSPEQVAEAVQLVAHRAVLEASGSISLDNVKQIAETGVDLISVGRLTHSAPSCDISMDFSKP